MKLKVTLYIPAMERIACLSRSNFVIPGSCMAIRPGLGDLSRVTGAPVVMPPLGFMGPLPVYAQLNVNCSSSCGFC